MTYQASEKREIIDLVERSSLPVRRTLDKLGNPTSTFYGWYERYREGGDEALKDGQPRCERIRNRIPDTVRNSILAPERPELSARELAVLHTDDSGILSRSPMNTFFRLESPSVIAKLREDFPGIGDDPDPRTVFLTLRELRNSR